MIAILLIIIIGVIVMNRDIKRINKLNPPTEEEQRRSGVSTNMVLFFVALMIAALMGMIK